MLAFFDEFQLRRGRGATPYGPWMTCKG
jgi:hypothetical protein